MQLIGGITGYPDAVVLFSLEDVQERVSETRLIFCLCDQKLAKLL